MEVLYTGEATAAIRAKAHRYKVLMAVLAGAALAVCAGLCFFVSTAAAGALQIAAIAVSTLAGWAVIIVWAAWYVPAKADYTHMEGILSCAEEEEYRGVLRTEDGVWHIPKSIWIRKVRLTGADGRAHSLSILASKAGLLPPDGTEVRVRTARKYIAALEVPHDEA